MDKLEKWSERNETEEQQGQVQHCELRMENNELQKNYAVNLLMFMIYHW